MSLLLLVIVLIVAMTMLFQMRAFAERQQYFMLPRQAARRAADYLSFYFAGASDANNYVKDAPRSPNALITYYNLNNNLIQASYNNLGCPDSSGSTTCTEPGNGARVIPANPPAIPTAINSTKFGDIGTDVITIVSPSNPGRYLVFPNFPPLGPNVDLYFNFRVGCGGGCGAPPLPACPAASDTDNMNAFKAAAGDAGAAGSALLMLVDKGGAWSYLQIPAAGYVASACNDVNGKNIHVKVDTASTTLPAPPNPTGAAVSNFVDPVYLITGLQVISFRILTDAVDGLPKLQQKIGLFDPATDNPGVAFTNVMENVEDLQVAYMYARQAAEGGGGPPDGSLVWNTASQTIKSTSPGCGTLPAPACDTHVPFQAGPNGAAPPLDISNVIGVRVSVTGRSPLLPLAAQKMTDVNVNNPLASTTSQHFRPRSEDHDVTDPPQYDLFDHYRQTTTLLLRNRIPGG